MLLEYFNNFPYFINLPPFISGKVNKITYLFIIPCFLTPESFKVALKIDY